VWVVGVDECGLWIVFEMVWLEEFGLTWVLCDVGILD